jgi:nitroimidazol reductase NimA-like FMN-containing flavoprotein (pyridoxamine 5'-phosphate oxidase superfamily)
MPGYGTEPAADGEGLLPWSWAEERLTESHDYWLATAWADGRPHVMPVWGAWTDGALWFSCSPTSRKCRNLEADPPCSAETDNALEPVVVDGRAERIDDADSTARFTALANDKYETAIPVEFFAANALFRLVPDKVIALTEADFTGSPTRWVLD